MRQGNITIEPFYIFRYCIAFLLNVSRNMITVFAKLAKWKHLRSTVTVVLLECYVYKYSQIYCLLFLIKRIVSLEFLFV